MMIREKLEFFIYGRKDCSLCDEMKQELAELLSDIDHSCHSIDVDSDPVLQQRYGARIPVLVHANRELAELKLDSARIRQYLTKLSK